MQKNTYQMVQISGSESEIQAFIEREIIKANQIEGDFQFIRVFTLSKELKEFLNVQFKLGLDSEKAQDLASLIQNQVATSNFDEKGFCRISFNYYTDKYIDTSFHEIKIIENQPTNFSIAIHENFKMIPDIWYNYLKSEFTDLQFLFSVIQLVDEIPTYKSNVIYNHGYNESDVFDFDNGSDDAGDYM